MHKLTQEKMMSDGITEAQKQQVRKAIREIAKIAGNQSRLAAKLGINRASVHGWLRKGRVPPLRVIPLEQISGGRVSRHRLCPELYPEETNENQG